MDKICIALGSDHAGFEYKKKALEWLKNRDYGVKDFGTFSSEPVDYPDIIHPLSLSISLGKYPFGVIFCGSGNGVCITANKYEKVRSALCWNAEVTSLARKHNNANVLAIPSRFMDWDTVEVCMHTFLNEIFQAGRHSIRVGKIDINRL